MGWGERMKQRYEIVFVVLVYGNTVDILDFYKSINSLDCSYKVIVVNSFYDEKSLYKCKKIAEENNSVFLEVENKGYGAGNNRGIEYAIRNFNFDFLIVSNPDIVVKELSYRRLKKYSKNVIGPKVITSTGKNQNPFYVDKKLFPKAEYHFLKNRNKIGYYSIIAVNKIKKILFFLGMKYKKKNYSFVYAVHGSFIIFSRYALDRIGNVFDENIFLFCEEMVLAEKMKMSNIKAVYTSDIEVYHKEDGSMKFLKGSMYDEEVKSNGYVLKKYFL